MENKQIKELMNAMARTGTKRLALKKEGVELELERGNQNDSIETSDVPESVSRNPMREDMEQHRHSISPSRVIEKESKEAEESDKPTGQIVTSPMVGTFYTTPSPDAEVFVKIGDTVEADSVICIVEAMKVMNEVKAGVTGKVREALVGNGDPVEFGTPLFVIE